MGGFVFTGAAEEEVWPLVRDFHYSKRAPSAVQHAFAIREPGGLFGDTGEPIAACIYSQPINRNHDPRALELSRLVRVEAYAGPPLSQFVSWSLRWLKKNCDAPFVLSYADFTQGHHGGIYQACNFIYVGETGPRHIGFGCPDGSFVHARSANSRFGTSSIAEIAKLRPELKPAFGLEKHLYIFPLKEKWASIEARTNWQKKPYPKPTLEAQKVNCA